MEPVNNIRLTLIVPFLNSHELVRRQLLNLHQNVGLNDFKDVECFFMDDGSDPPHLSDPKIVAAASKLERLTIIPTNEFRPWTSSLARNMGAIMAHGDWLFMHDGDFFIPTRQALETAREFATGQYGDRLGIRRQLGVILEDGTVTQDLDVLEAWGVPRSHLDRKGAYIGPHPNHYIISKATFWLMGGYDPKLILERTYPQGEDNYLKKIWCRLRDVGEAQIPDGNGGHKLLKVEKRPTQGPDDMRPMMWMFPNGQFCGDVDTNPFGLFHELSRKSPRNPYTGDKLLKDGR
jgi:hypothetical protein